MHSVYQLRELRCPPLLCCLGGYMEPDVKHSELLLVCTYLSPYYAVRFTGLFNIYLM